jgi:phosphoribosylamine-glycine ligase
VGVGDGLAAAREVANRAVGEAMLEGAQYRTDIALREVEA